MGKNQTEKSSDGWRCRLMASDKSVRVYESKSIFVRKNQNRMQIWKQQRISFDCYKNYLKFLKWSKKQNLYLYALLSLVKIKVSQKTVGKVYNVVPPLLWHRDVFRCYRHGDSLLYWLIPTAYYVANIQCLKNTNCWYYSETLNFIYVKKNACNDENVIIYK